jgi:hypothetical protein
MVVNFFSFLQETPQFLSNEIGLAKMFDRSKRERQLNRAFGG